MTERKVTIGGNEVKIESRDQLQNLISKFPDIARLEINVDFRDSRSLLALLNGDRAYLMLTLLCGGFASRSEPVIEQKLVQFTLSNGQVDELPFAWTVSRDQAVATLIDFWTSGDPGTRVIWEAW